MNARSLKFKPRVVQIILITATILFVVAYIVVSRQMHVEQRSAFRSIRRVYRLRDQLTRLGLTLDGAETGQRRFLLTGHYQELSPYLSNRSEIRSVLSSLEQLVADDPVQSGRFLQLRSLVDRKFAEIDETVLLKGSGQSEQALQLVNSNREIDLMQAIHTTLQSMQDHENQLLAKQLETNESKLHLQETMSSVLLGVTAVVAIGAGILLRRIQRLQSIITICAWTQRVNYNGKWMQMDEFLWKRFRVRVSHGISEEAFDGVMGIVGKGLTVSDAPNEPPTSSQE
ncbi:MAG: CHASE3 domain-containing protein [Chthoniobacterales bacterium]